MIFYYYREETLFIMGDNITNVNREKENNVLENSPMCLTDDETKLVDRNNVLENLAHSA